MKSLKNYHTKQLKKMLSLSYKFNGVYIPSGEVCGFESDEIRAELNTREHVPNKIEARRMRQEKARSRKNR
jgi:hypothetical protein